MVILGLDFNMSADHDGEPLATVSYHSLTI